MPWPMNVNDNTIYFKINKIQFVCGDCFVWRNMLIFLFVTIQNDWINRSFFDVIHPEDEDKIKDQLKTEVSPDTRTLDLKSKIPYMATG